MEETEASLDKRQGAASQDRFKWGKETDRLTMVKGVCKQGRGRSRGRRQHET